MPKKTDIELSDALLEEVGDGPSPAELPDDAELADLFDSLTEVCPECGVPFEIDSDECVECSPFVPFDEQDFEGMDDDDPDA
jgi:hypothetical protein